MGTAIPLGDESEVDGTSAQYKHVTGGWSYPHIIQSLDPETKMEEAISLTDQEFDTLVRLSPAYKELAKAAEGLVNLFIYEGLCQQCCEKGGHLDWCLVGKAKEVLNED